MGIGRNQYIELMNQYRAKVGLCVVCGGRCSRWVCVLCGVPVARQKGEPVLRV